MPPHNKIAIISVLKPVDDARNYKKIAKTLAENDFNEIWIMGFPSNTQSDNTNIHFIPTKPFTRISLHRLFIPITILLKLIKVKPDVIIVNTHELLGVTILNKILFGCKIIYDIQENYFANIRFTKSFPIIVKTILAYDVRLKENIAARFMDGFILSDRCYANELKFIHNPFQVIENKSVIHYGNRIKKKNSNELTFTYSGTIAEEYGIFDAIDFVKLLKEHIPHLQLTIIGYCANRKTYRELIKSIQDESYIKIIGGNQLVPQNEIVKRLEESDFCILPYRIDTYYSNRIPTKIYDCLCLNKPMIIRNNPAWEHLYHEFDSFIFTDFKKVEQEILDTIQSRNFYTKGNLKKAQWNSEKGKLFDLIDEVL